MREVPIGGGTKMTGTITRIPNGGTDCYCRPFHGWQALESAATLFRPDSGRFVWSRAVDVSLSVSTDALSVVLRHGSRTVGLTGVVNESAFIRDLQWDTYGTRVLHVDFTRISVDELVKRV